MIKKNSHAVILTNGTKFILREKEGSLVITKVVDTSKEEDQSIKLELCKSSQEIKIK